MFICITMLKVIWCFALYWCLIYCGSRKHAAEKHASQGQDERKWCLHKPSVPRKSYTYVSVLTEIYIAACTLFQFELSHNVYFNQHSSCYKILSWHSVKLQ